MLESAEIIEKRAEDLFLLEFDYHLMPAVMQALKKLDILVVQQVFENFGQVTIAVGKSEVEDVFLRLKAHIQSVSLEEAALITNIHGLRIQFEGSR